MIIFKCNHCGKEDKVEKYDVEFYYNSHKDVFKNLPENWAFAMWKDGELNILDKWIRSDEVVAIFDDYFSTDEELKSVCDHLSAIMIADFGFYPEPELLRRLAAFGLVMSSFGYAMSEFGNPLEK